jgi:hypothetical protein
VNEQIHSFWRLFAAASLNPSLWWWLKLYTINSSSYQGVRIYITRPWVCHSDHIHSFIPSPSLLIPVCLIPFHCLVIQQQHHVGVSTFSPIKFVTLSYYVYNKLACYLRWLSSSLRCSFHKQPSLVLGVFVASLASPRPNNKRERWDQLFRSSSSRGEGEAWSFF